MISKKEYLTHLDYGVNTCPTIYDAFKELINAYFDPEPYKFEDLKPGMWVYDIIKDICVKIEELIIEEHVKGFWICNPFRTRLYPCEFEEGRFFPVTKAMEVKYNE